MLTERLVKLGRVRQLMEPRSEGHPFASTAVAVVVAMVVPSSHRSGVTPRTFDRSEAAGVERIARSVVLAVGVRIVLSAIAGVFDRRLRSNLA